MAAQISIGNHSDSIFATFGRVKFKVVEITDVSDYVGKHVFLSIRLQDEEGGTVIKRCDSRSYVLAKSTTILKLDEEYLFDVYSTNTLAISLLTRQDSPSWLSDSVPTCAGVLHLPIFRFEDGCVPISQWYQMTSEDGEGLRCSLKLEIEYKSELVGRLKNSEVPQDSLLNDADSRASSSGLHSRRKPTAMEMISQRRQEVAVDRISRNSTEHNKRGEQDSASLKGLPKLKSPEEDLGYDTQSQQAQSPITFDDEEDSWRLSVDALGDEDSEALVAETTLAVGIIDYVILLGPVTHQNTDSRYTATPTEPSIIATATGQEKHQGNGHGNSNRSRHSNQAMHSQSSSDFPHRYSDEAVGSVTVWDRFPPSNHADTPLPTKIEWFACPEGAISRTANERPDPVLSSFLLSSSAGASEVFGVTLTFFALESNIYASRSSIPADSGEDSGASGGAGDHGYDDSAGLLWWSQSLSSKSEAGKALGAHENALFDRLCFDAAEAKRRSLCLGLTTQDREVLRAAGKDRRSDKFDASATSTETGGRCWVGVTLCVVSKLPLVMSLSACIEWIYWVVILRQLQAWDANGRDSETISPSSAASLSFAMSDVMKKFCFSLPAPIAGFLRLRLELPHRMMALLPTNTANSNDVETNGSSSSGSCPDVFSVLFSMSPAAGLPDCVYPLQILLLCLGPRGVMHAVMSALFECKILFHSTDLSILPAICEGITSLLYPFKWTHVYLPVVPARLLDLVDAPVPFMLGTHSSWLQFVAPDSLTDVVLIDCDSGKISRGAGFFSPRSWHMDPASFALPDGGSLEQSHTRRVGGAFPTVPIDVERFLIVGMMALTSFSGSPLSSDSMRSISYSQHLQLLFLDAMVYLLKDVPDCLFFLGPANPVFNRPLFLEECVSPLDTTLKAFLSELVNTNLFYQLVDTLYSPERALFARAVKHAKTSRVGRNMSTSTSGSPTGNIEVGKGKESAGSGVRAPMTAVARLCLERSMSGTELLAEVRSMYTPLLLVSTGSNSIGIVEGIEATGRGDASTGGGTEGETGTASHCLASSAGRELVLNLLSVSSGKSTGRGVENEESNQGDESPEQEEQEDQEQNVAARVVVVGRSIVTRAKDSGKVKFTRPRVLKTTEESSELNPHSDLAKLANFQTSDVRADRVREDDISDLSAEVRLLLEVGSLHSSSKSSSSTYSDSSDYIPGSSSGAGLRTPRKSLRRSRLNRDCNFTSPRTPKASPGRCFPVHFQQAIDSTGNSGGCDSRFVFPEVHHIQEKVGLSDSESDGDSAVYMPRRRNELKNEVFSTVNGLPIMQVFINRPFPIILDETGQYLPPLSQSLSVRELAVLWGAPLSDVAGAFIQATRPAASLNISVEEGIEADGAIIAALRQMYVSDSLAGFHEEYGSDAQASTEAIHDFFRTVLSASASEPETHESGAASIDELITNCSVALQSKAMRSLLLRTLKYAAGAESNTCVVASGAVIEGKGKLCKVHSSTFEALARLLLESFLPACSSQKDYMDAIRSVELSGLFYHPCNFNSPYPYNSKGDDAVTVVTQHSEGSGNAKSGSSAPLSRRNFGLGRSSSSILSLSYEFLSSRVCQHPIFQNTSLWLVVLSDRLALSSSPSPSPPNSSTHVDTPSPISSNDDNLEAARVLSKQLDSTVHEIQSLLHLMRDVGVNSERAMMFLQAATKEHELGLNAFYDLQRFTTSMWAASLRASSSQKEQREDEASYPYSLRSVSFSEGAVSLSGRDGGDSITSPSEAAEGIYDTFKQRNYEVNNTQDIQLESFLGFEGEASIGEDPEYGVEGPISSDIEPEDESACGYKEVVVAMAQDVVASTVATFGTLAVLGTFDGSLRVCDLSQTSLKAFMPWHQLTHDEQKSRPSTSRLLGRHRANKERTISDGGITNAQFLPGNSVRDPLLISSCANGVISVFCGKVQSRASHWTSEADFRDGNYIPPATTKRSSFAGFSFSSRVKAKPAASTDYTVNNDDMRPTASFTLLFSRKVHSANITKFLAVAIAQKQLPVEPELCSRNSAQVGTHEAGPATLRWLVLSGDCTGQVSVTRGVRGDGVLDEVGEPGGKKKVRGRFVSFARAAPSPATPSHSSSDEVEKCSGEICCLAFGSRSYGLGYGGLSDGTAFGTDAVISGSGSGLSVVSSLSMLDFAFAGTSTGGLNVIDMSQLKSVYRIRSHETAVTGIAPMHAHEVFTCGSDRAVKLWDLRAKSNGKVVVSARGLGPDNFNRSAQGSVTSMVVGGSTGTIVITAAADNLIRLWDLRFDSTCPAVVFTGHTNSVSALHWDGLREERFFSAGLDGCVRQWSSLTGRCTQVVRAFTHVGVESLHIHKTTPTAPAITAGAVGTSDREAVGEVRLDRDAATNTASWIVVKSINGIVKAFKAT